VESFGASDAENGCSASELATKYPGVDMLWRREIDPCRRNMVRFEFSQRLQYQRRVVEFEERQQLMIEAEIQAHLSTDADQAAFEMEDRFYRYQGVMNDVCVALGFRYDPQKSRDEFPVFSKQPIDGWDLCWTLQHTDTFALTPKLGCFAPNLDLRGANLAGDVDKARSREFLCFRYQSIVPGFDRAYWKFRNLVELEWAIRAHLTLYELIMPILEASVAGAGLDP
jgi:hypothetical protein